MGKWEIDLKKIKTELKQLIDDNKHSYDPNQRVFPQYLSFQTKKLSTDENKAGVRGEQDVHDGLKKLAIEDGDWYLIHEIGEPMQKLLEEKPKKNFFEELLDRVKDKIGYNEGYAPDFVFMNKKYGIFLIDSKNVTENNALEAFQKAINQCKIFKLILETLNEDYAKLPFYMGAYIPLNIRIKLNNNKTFIINNLRYDEGLRMMFESLKCPTIDEDVYNHFLKFLVKVKTKGVSQITLNDIDGQLKEYTKNKVKQKPSLIGKKLILNGPAGSGKTYRIMENIINLLKFKQKILLVFEDEFKMNEVKKEAVGEIKLYKYLNDINELYDILKPFDKRNKDLKIKVYIYENEEKIDYFLLFITVKELNYFYVDSIESGASYLNRLTKYLNDSDFIVETSSHHVKCDRICEESDKKIYFIFITTKSLNYCLVDSSMSGVSYSNMLAQYVNNGEFIVETSSHYQKCDKLCSVIEYVKSVNEKNKSNAEK